ncbi:MAG TPA: O-antigen ligase family protein [Rudaea sp.]|nr:O-antigen ligase family protein [Rudaea sp.]
MNAAAHAQRSHAAPRVRRKADSLRNACAVMLVLAVVFGGGTTAGLRGDMILELAALPVLGMGFARLREQPPTVLARFGLVWLGLVALLFVVQCLPLPESWWLALGARGELAREMAQAGVAATHSLSLDRYATERMLWTLLPPAAVYIAAIGVRMQDRLELLLLAVLLAGASIVLGLAQVAAGPESPLRFYAVTNPTEAVGFFANRNHYAAMLYMLLPLAVGAFGAGLAEWRAGYELPRLRLVGYALVVILVILGLVLSRSRAGIVLGMVGLAASLLVVATIVRRAAAPSRVRRIVAITAIVGILLAVQYGLYGVLERLENDPADDARWTLLATTLEAARHFGAWGSGFGTFVHAYQSFETPAVMLPAFANHAHDDWAELWLEAGWPAAALALAFLAWFAAAALRAWQRSDAPPAFVAARRAASISIALVLLHETVDYSLRTEAVLSMFALLCAVLVGNGSRSAGDGKRSRTPARSH